MLNAFAILFEEFYALSQFIFLIVPTDWRTGSPWRDLPAAFGRWNTVFKRYRDWVKADVFVRLFEACSDEPDMEYALVDATIVKVHRHGQGSKGGLKARPSAAPKAA